MKLIIIGNGFDVSHGIKSKYKDFKDYLFKKCPENASIYEDFYNPAELWSDFEHALGKPNLEFKKRVSSIFGMPFNPSHLAKNFYSWVNSLNNQFSMNDSKKELSNFFENSYFLTFNYTHTLEFLYKIEDTKILYIHGFAAPYDPDLFPIIFGHNEPVKKDEDELITNFRKDIKACLKKLSSFIKDKRQSIDEIYTFGFSYNDIDYEYFDFINKVLPSAKWHFSFHTQDDKKALFNYVEKLQADNNGRKIFYEIFEF